MRHCNTPALGAVGLALTALLFTGCSTKVETYRPDGKTLATRTIVGMAHEVQLPEGVKVTTSEGWITAGQNVAVKALEIGGAALAQHAIDRAAETATQKPQ